MKEKYLWCMFIITIPLGLFFIKLGADLGIGVYLTQGSRWGEFIFFMGLLILILGTLIPLFELYDRYSKK